MEHLVDYLLSWLGSTVQIERSGPEACEGLLAAVCGDYMTLLSDEGAQLHLPLRHVRSVTLLSEAAPGFTPVEVTASSFLDLTREHVGHQVRLYHAGPEVCAGRLLACGDDYVLLEIAPGQVTCLALFHIRSLLLLPEEADSAESLAQDSNQGR